MIKRAVLINLIEENNLKGFSILGVLKKIDDNSLLEENLNNIGFKDFKMYFSETENEVEKKLCCITFENLSSEVELIRVEEFFNIIYDYYQATLNEKLANIVLGNISEKIKFEDFTESLGLKNKDISQIILKSRQSVADVLKGRTNLTLISLSLLIKAFPLMPWQQYIIGISSI